MPASPITTATIQAAAVAGNTAVSTATSLSKAGPERRRHEFVNKWPIVKGSELSVCEVMKEYADNISNMKKSQGQNSADQDEPSLFDVVTFFALMI